MAGPSLHEWHDQILEEEHASIIECLGPKQAKILSIEKTAFGYRIAELCDGYYGTTLSQDQLERLISELQELAKVKAG